MVARIVQVAKSKNNKLYKREKCKMIHGINNRFLYTAKKVTCKFFNGTSELSINGTGFFVVKSSDIYFLTNRHVVDAAYYDPKYIGYKLASLKIESYSSFNEEDIPTKMNNAEIINISNFKFHSDYGNDVACLKSPRVEGEGFEIICHIDYDMLANKNWINKKLNVCDNLAYPCFAEWYDTENNTPIFRIGTIASDPRLNYSRTDLLSADRIAYEGFSSSGASGSPIFALQKGVRLGDGIQYVGNDDFYREVKLIGINGGHFKSYEQGHSGISFFYKSSCIVDLIDSCENQ